MAKMLFKRNLISKDCFLRKNGTNYTYNSYTTADHTVQPEGVMEQNVRYAKRVTPYAKRPS